MAGHSKNYSADELQLLASYCKGALCDQNHLHYLSSAMAKALGWKVCSDSEEGEEDVEG